MGFPRQEHLIGLPCPPPGDLPDPGFELNIEYITFYSLGKVNPKVSMADVFDLRTILQTTYSDGNLGD